MNLLAFNRPVISHHQTNQRLREGDLCVLGVGAGGGKARKEGPGLPSTVARLL